MTRALRLSASMAVLAAAVSFPSGADAADVKTASKALYGRYLVDDNGRSIYLFEADRRGVGKSTCHNACAKAWPPMPANAEPHVKGEALSPDKLGSFEREGGSRQLTYNGWPLYYYVKDQQPGDVKGQDVHGFGGEWDLVGPNGHAVEEKEQEHG